MSSLLRCAHLCCLVVLLGGASSAVVPSDPRMNLYDVTHYDLTVAFDIPHETYSGSVRVEATALHPLEEVVLSADNETLTIDSVAYAGASAPFHHATDHLAITLNPPVHAQDHIAVTVYYHGISKFRGQYDGGGVYFTHTDSVGRAATISQPFFARRWWPCKDVPSDKATASVTVTVPSRLTAVSNGILRTVESHGSTKTYRWETRYPIATYLVSIAAAEYREYSETYTTRTGKEMPILYYVFPKDFEKAKKDFEDTRHILDFLSTEFCEYPFVEEKFGYAEVEGNLTLENQTICSIEEALISGDKRYQMTIIHETCHQWWGDLITPVNWKHTWLNEGFATFTEALYLEHEKGADAYRHYMHSIMTLEDGRLKGSVSGRSDTAFWDSFSGTVYYKGAVVLHMLRTMLGDSVFFSILRSYVNNPELRYGSVSTEEFITECEHISGRSLRWFFDQWVYAYTDSVDRPDIQYHWTATPTQVGFDLTLELQQLTASKLLYRLPLTVTISSEETERSLSIIDSLSAQSFHFSVPEKPIRLEIDRDEHIFKTLRKKD